MITSFFKTSKPIHYIIFLIVLICLFVYLLSPFLLLFHTISSLPRSPSLRVSLVSLVLRLLPLSFPLVYPSLSFRHLDTLELLAQEIQVYSSGRAAGSLLPVRLLDQLPQLLLILVADSLSQASVESAVGFR